MAKKFVALKMMQIEKRQHYDQSNESK